MSYTQCTINDPESPTIGLFGTCGGSNWRESFINEFIEKDIQFFNPNKQDWNPEDAESEASHLISDDIVLFPITGETFGTASLAETAFSVLRCITEHKNKYAVIMIEDLNEELKKTNPQAYKESRNAREIVKAHLFKIEDPNVFVVDNLEKMQKIAVALYSHVKNFNSIKLI